MGNIRESQGRGGQSSNISGDDIFAGFFGGDKNRNVFEGSSSMPPRDDIFAEFFGVDRNRNVFEGSSSMPPRDNVFAEVFGGDTNQRNRNVFEGSSSMSPRKGATIERKLPCSLEDLYNGTTKKMKISREVFNATGSLTTHEEILMIGIKPGWKKGTRIIFPQKGNEQRGVIPSDLAFIIDEKPHDVFKRDGNDLVATQNISLAEGQALTGYVAHLTTLDGRSLTIHINSVINPTYEKIVKGEGMPISKEPAKRGNLRVQFNITYLK